MAKESDQVELLGDDSESASHPAPRNKRNRTVLGLGLGAIAAAALWRSGVASDASPQVSVMSIMSAAWLPPTFETVCRGAAVVNGVNWPHRFEDVNWEGEKCRREGGNREGCEERLIGKYVGDFFDSFLKSVTDDEKSMIPTSARELSRWKDRVILLMQAYAKKHQSVTVGGKQVLLMNALEVPDEFNVVQICEAIEIERPIVALAVDNCRPNYASWASLKETLGTIFPSTTAGFGTQDSGYDGYSFPAELSSETNASLESCRKFLTHSSGADWVESTLAALDVRSCLHSGGAEQTRLSRSWVSNCIPYTQKGYPAHVFNFMAEYGIPGEDCVPNYGRLETGHCPSLCESGASLAGHLKRAAVSSTVIFAHTGLKFGELDESKHRHAKEHIFNDGPIVGMVHQTSELAACALDDRIIYPNGCGTEVWDGTLDDMHSVVVHGWGSEGGTDYYRIVTSFQGDDHEARIAACALKFFVIPQTPKGFASSDYDARLQAIRADARCPRSMGFCNANEGYTDTEDCDGDGVLDHWCYKVGAGETPTYEAFISSRKECNVVEESCRRSVLPGRAQGCQRPLGWCMNGEHYRRDRDCDGDGHFDHSCETEGHAGFIQSHIDTPPYCLDTWEEGTTGRKCEPQTLLNDASIQYKLVSEYGSCVQQHNTQCFASHADWPNSRYPVGVCQFHVEWTQPVASDSKKEGCDTTPEPEETLYLEVVQMNIEGAEFNTNGYLFGERLQVNGVNTQNTLNGETRRNNAEYVQVKDKAVIQWTTDQSVQQAGWLVCLRLKKRLPERPSFHNATCSEIGDDVWSMYFTEENPTTVVPVECDMTKCNTANVKTVDDASPYLFVRTTNICDAGWQASKSSKFDVSFSPATASSEASFEVLL